MSRDINWVVLRGNIGQDPETQFTNGGTKVAKFSVATHYQVTDKSGTNRQLTEWHRIKAYGKQAEICERDLRKGSRVRLEGRLKTSHWTDKDDVKRFITEVIANDVDVLFKPETSNNKEEGNA